MLNWSLEVKWLLKREQQLSGIGNAYVKGKLGRVTAIVVDETAVSPPIEFKAHLLNDDSVPLLIGYEDFLKSIILTSDYPNKTAYMDWPEELQK